MLYINNIETKETTEGDGTTLWFDILLYFAVNGHTNTFMCVKCDDVNLYISNFPLQFRLLLLIVVFFRNVCTLPRQTEDNDTFQKKRQINYWFQGPSTLLMISVWKCQPISS